MVSTDLTKEELLNEVRRLKKNVGGRIKKIDALGFSLEKSASTDYKKFLEEYKNLGKNTSEKELRSAYRDLKYIDQLKTSTVKGAREAFENFADLSGMLTALSRTEQDKFWEIYKRFYETSGGMAERFKYEVFEAILDARYSGMDVDEFSENLNKIFVQVYVESKGAGGTDAELDLLFTEKLADLFDSY